MKTFYYGSPDGRLVQWAFRMKNRWPLARYALILPVALIFAVVGPVAWLCVQVGHFGHWLAYAVGIDSHDAWR